ncbi:hypothetical protein OQA88_8523 [Cercophora sp. LCS_1]
MASLATSPTYDGRLRYQRDLPDKTHLAKAWNLFQQYSHIPEDEIEPHVRRVRDKAFSVFNYPCLGRFRFLDLYITTHPFYPSLITRTQAGEILLDAGCCVGQALRQLAHDGAPQANLRGLDLRPEFVELGYELFKDKDTFGAKFVTGDIFDIEDAGLQQLDGTVDIVHAAAFFHLFGWDEQVKIGERFVRFFRREQKNAVVLGRQVGTRNPGSVEEQMRLWKRYHHDEASMQRLWDEIGERTGTRWRVEAELETGVDVLEGGGEEVERTTIRYLVRKV